MNGLSVPGNYVSLFSFDRVFFKAAGFYVTGSKSRVSFGKGRLYRRG